MLRIERFDNLDFERLKASQNGSSKLVAHRINYLFVYFLVDIIDFLTPEAVPTTESLKRIIMQLIKQQNPTLTPAINHTWIDTWGRVDVSSIYRISHYQMSGRMTDGISNKKEINLPRQI